MPNSRKAKKGSPRDPVKPKKVWRKVPSKDVAPPADKPAALDTPKPDQKAKCTKCSTLFDPHPRIATILAKSHSFKTKVCCPSCFRSARTPPSSPGRENPKPDPVKPEDWVPVDEKDFCSFLGAEVVCHADPCSDGVKCTKRSHFHREKKPKSGAQKRIAEKPVEKAKEKPPLTQIRARKCPRTIEDCPDAGCHHHPLKRGKKQVSEDLDLEVDAPLEFEEAVAHPELLELPGATVKVATQPKKKKGKNRKEPPPRSAVVTRYLGELLTIRLRKYFAYDSMEHIPRAVGVILAKFDDDDEHIMRILSDDDMFVKEMTSIAGLMSEFYCVELQFESPSDSPCVGGGPASGPPTMPVVPKLPAPTSVPSPVSVGPTPVLKPETVTLGNEEKKTLPLGRKTEHAASSVPVTTESKGGARKSIPQREPSSEDLATRLTVLQILKDVNTLTIQADPPPPAEVKSKPPPPSGPPPQKMTLAPMGPTEALPSIAIAPSTQTAPVAAPLGPEQGACTQMVPFVDLAPLGDGITSSLVTVFFYNSRGEDKAFTRLFTNFLSALPMINRRSELHPIDVVGSASALPHTEGHQIAVRSGLYFGRKNAYNPTLFTVGNEYSQYEVAFLEKFGFTTRKNVYIFDQLFDYLLSDSSTQSISVLRVDGTVNETCIRNLKYGCTNYKKINLLNTLSRERVDNTVIAAFQQRLIAEHRMRSAMGRQTTFGRPLNSG